MFKEHGLTEQDIEVPGDTLKAISKYRGLTSKYTTKREQASISCHDPFSSFASVSNYTRESGVRSLERKIGGVCRAVAVQVGNLRFDHRIAKVAHFE